jgi:D-alanyl-D-alanine carboxypeptidase
MVLATRSLEAAYRLTIMASTPAGGEPGSDPGQESGPSEGRGGRSGGRVFVGILAGALVTGAILAALVLGGPALAPTGVAVVATGSPSAAVSEGPVPATAIPTVSAATTPTATASGSATPIPPPPPVPDPTASPSESTPSPSATPLTSTGVPAAKLQRRLDALRKKLAIPGVSVAILWDDGRQWLGASGLADVGAKAPMTTQTGFALASISKTFTAAVVLQLVEEGRLSLGQSVAPLLPGFGLDRRITVKMLLDHTSGLPDYFLNPKIDRPLQAAPNATWSVDQTLAYVSKKRPVPGRRWNYSNTNYLLLGELVERVTGHPISVEVRKRLLDPLGLDHAWYQSAETARAKGTIGYRILPLSGGGVRFAPLGRVGGIMPFRSVVTAAGGAGSMAATALDTARWMRAYAGGSVLSPATRKLQVADVAATKKLGARIPYGLGIQALPIADHKALGHSGRFLGFRNVARYLPRDGVSIAVLTNQGVQDPAIIATSLLKVVLAMPPAPSASPSASPLAGTSAVQSASPAPSPSPSPSG